MIEHPQYQSTSVLIVHIERLEDQLHEDLAEFRLLAVSAGAKIIAENISRRNVATAKYFLGSGKAEEIAQLVKLHQVELVLVNADLTPAQERNLERLWLVRVLDRSGLILDIFAQRARSSEGKLQVELAQLQHLSTRLVRGWTHLERQKGGIGLRGPGETQLETDKRLIRQRIKVIQKRLAKVRLQRDLGRRNRQKSHAFMVSLVGYTNAGKSTLFNYLTGEHVYVADQLFATLDPTLGQLSLAHSGNIILADTVGFIRHLPHSLIDAFAATLEETRDADLLLHVIDVHHEQMEEQIAQVETVLAQIGADKVPTIRVYNKIDLLTHAEAHNVLNAAGKVMHTWLSAKTGVGIDLLVQALMTHLLVDPITRQVYIPSEQAKLRAYLYEQHVILDERLVATGGWQCLVRLERKEFQRLFPDCEI